MRILMGISSGGGMRSRSGDQHSKDGGDTGPIDDHDVHSRDIKEEESLIYRINDIPPIYVSILLGLQHFSAMFMNLVSNVLVLSGPLCIGNHWEGRAQLLSTVAFTAGLTTILQSTFGTRLPIIQGASSSYVPPIMAIMSQRQWQCPVGNSTLTTTPSSTQYTTPGFSASTGQSSPKDQTPPWHYRMREIQGALIVASLFQLFIGLSGLLGFLLRFVTPMVIAVVISLIGFSLMPIAARNSSSSWPFSIATMILCILMSQYLRNLKIPVPTYSRELKKCKRGSYPIFSVYPILISLGVVWLLCAVLTATNVLSRDITWQYNARTDTRAQVLDKAPWFRVPYPFKWGPPTLSASAAIGMSAAAFSSMIESIGDYYACARASGAPPPPIHACNRGIGLEGFGGVLCGMLGTGAGHTSYSENIAFLLLTKVGSRRVAQFGALWMIFLGILAKFGALFATLPDPIVGGILFFSIGMVSSTGISYLQYINMNSSRNLFILGFSLCAGVGVPSWVSDTPGAINTGNQTADQVLTVLLRTPMLLGGIVAFVLDNTVPGRVQNSSILEVMNRIYDQPGNDGCEGVYNLPYVTKLLSRQKWTYYVPFCPTFTPGCGEPKIQDTKL